MAIPQDKYVTESNVVLSQFIGTAAALGMPVALLQKVRKDYTIKYKRK